MGGGGREGEGMEFHPYKKGEGGKSFSHPEASSRLQVPPPATAPLMSVGTDAQVYEDVLNGGEQKVVA